MTKRLTRSRTDKVIGGVCGGLGEYFEVDPVFIRILTVLFALAIHGFGVIAYIVAMIIIPKKEFEFQTDENGKTVPVEEIEEKRGYSSWNRYLPGMLLICFGLILLIRENIYWFGWDEFWPLVLVIGGLYLIFRKKDKPHDPLEQSAEVHNGQTKPDDGGSLA